jgi:hypothetical protein
MECAAKRYLLIKAILIKNDSLIARYDYPILYMPIDSAR